MKRRRTLSLEEDLARIDREIAKLEVIAVPLRDKLHLIEGALGELKKSRQAKEAGSAGGRAKRRVKHDYESAFKTYDALGGRGALTQTAKRHGIPLRTLSWALDRRSTA
ncbi:hypothetical protein [Brevundimonas sp.]|uniref:hypothetical protein n=1 Tax=Brevundimonas sp. TaxID=1871086 RepID=UPI002AB84EC7|nr:hypothetical protein [Brevundimonas sp.]MDZ4363719.1 hypothetical protein [Brevundimonas sp.]